MMEEKSTHSKLVIIQYQTQIQVPAPNHRHEFCSAQQTTKTRIQISMHANSLAFHFEDNIPRIDVEEE